MNQFQIIPNLHLWKKNLKKIYYFFPKNSIYLSNDPYKIEMSVKADTKCSIHKPKKKKKPTKKKHKCHLYHNH